MHNENSANSEAKSKVKMSAKDKVVRAFSLIALIIMSLYTLFSVYALIATAVSPDKSPSLFGFSFTVNPNDAMAGTESDSIKAGSMIITRDVPISDIKAGAVVVYKEQGDIFVGRFLGESPYAKGYYLVKADNYYDSYEVLMTEANLVGAVVRSADWMGDIALFAITPVGEVLTFWIPLAVALIALLSFVLDLIGGKGNGPESEEVEVKTEPEAEIEHEAEPEPEAEIEVEAEAEPEPEFVLEPEIKLESSGDADTAEAVIKGTDGEEHIVYIRYRKSYTARLIQSDDELKRCYDFVKNELLSYKKVKSRISFVNESFNVGRIKCAKLAIRGKALWLYLNLDPKEYEGTRYRIKDNSDKPKYKDVPLAIKLKTERSMKYAGELIAAMMERLDLARTEREYESFYMPYEENASLVERDLIKVYYSSDVTDGATLVGANINEMLKFMGGANADSEQKEQLLREEPTAEPEAEAEQEYEAEPEEETEESSPAAAADDVVYVRYRKSYMARLIQSEDGLKECYGAVKNELLSYKRVKSRTSFTCESFNAGRIKCAKLSIQGKALWLYLNLDPGLYADSKYRVKDKSDKPKYRDVPLAIKLKTPRSVKHSKILIADMMATLGLEKTEREAESFYMPYEDNDALIERDLIKVYYSKDVTEKSRLVGANINEMLKHLDEGDADNECKAVKEVKTDGE